MSDGFVIQQLYSLNIMELVALIVLIFYIERTRRKFLEQLPLNLGQRTSLHDATPCRGYEGMIFSIFRAAFKLEKVKKRQ